MSFIAYNYYHTESSSYHLAYPSLPFTTGRVTKASLLNLAPWLSWGKDTDKGSQGMEKNDKELDAKARLL